MIDLETALQVLVRRGVEFIIVGGVAATIHGSARVTRDLDIEAQVDEQYERTPTAHCSRLQSKKRASGAAGVKPLIYRSPA